MLIVTILSSLYSQRLVRALTREIAVAQCATLTECTSRLAGSVHGVIVDPLLFDEEETRELLRISRAHQIPVIFYTKLTRQSITRMLPALKKGDADIIIADMDDYPERLCRSIESLPSISVGARLVSALAPAFPLLDPAVGRELFTILLDPSVISAKALRKQGEVSRRTIERDLTRARLAPLHRWWSVSRLTRSFTALAEANVNYTQAAKAAGYASARSLDQQYMKMMHIHLAEVRQRLSQREFVARAAQALLQPKERARP